MTLKIENTSKRPVLVQLETSDVDWNFYPIVRNDDGIVVWDRISSLTPGPNGMIVFGGTGLEIELSPHAARTFFAVWPKVTAPVGDSVVLHVTPQLLGALGTPIWTGGVVDIRVRP